MRLSFSDSRAAPLTRPKRRAYARHMRNSQPKSRGLSFRAYLALEKESLRKHEFVQGEMYAMAGVTLRHDAISTNILMHLKRACAGTACNAYSSDVKVRPVEEIAYYPDASLDCVRHNGTDLLIEHPCLVVEVTSRTTIRTDRGEKALNYQRSSSLQTYLIVDQNRRRVTWYHRDASGAWVVEEVEYSGAIDLPCTGTRLTLDEIYEGVELPPLGVDEPDVDELTGAYVTDV